MRSWLKPVVFAACLIPLVLLVIDAIRGNLGVNPIETITHQTGLWALRFLLITLAMSPLRSIGSVNWPLQLRRMLGLYAFFYSFLHLTTYIVLDQFFDWPAVVADIVKRPYITVGFSAFVLLIPLAVTSTNGMVRRLGRRWKPLHRLTYVIGILAVVHFLWLVKADLLEPVIYGSILAALLIWRIPPVRKRLTRQRKSARAQG